MVRCEYCGRIKGVDDGFCEFCTPVEDPEPNYVCKFCGKVRDERSMVFEEEGDFCDEGCYEEWKEENGGDNA